MQLSFHGALTFRATMDSASASFPAMALISLPLAPSRPFFTAASVSGHAAGCRPCALTTDP